MKAEETWKPLFSQREAALNVNAEAFVVITKLNALALLHFKEGHLV